MDTETVARPHDGWIKIAGELLREDDRIRAAWVAGSYAAGTADAYSDLDLHAVITDDAVDWFRDHWRSVAIGITGPAVLADPIPNVLGGLVITPDWRHLDLVLYPVSGLSVDPAAPRKVLFDHDRLLPAPTPVPDPFAPGAPHFPTATVNLFWYFLGNLPVTVGRGEVIVALGGVQALRDLLVELMLAERGIRRSGGRKRLNPFLSDEQRSILEAIPPADARVPAIVAAIRVITDDFLVRGRRLAESVDAEWPHPLVEATLDHLDRNLPGGFRQRDR